MANPNIIVSDVDTIRWTGSEYVEFNVRMYEPHILQLIIGFRSSYSAPAEKDIYFYWHGNAPEDLAFRCLIYDATHEYLHLLIAQFEGVETSSDLDKLDIDGKSELCSNLRKYPVRR